MNKSYIFASDQGEFLYIAILFCEAAIKIIFECSICIQKQSLLQMGSQKSQRMAKHENEPPNLLKLFFFSSKCNILTDIFPIKA